MSCWFLEPKVYVMLCHVNYEHGPLTFDKLKVSK